MSHGAVQLVTASNYAFSDPRADIEEIGALLKQGMAACEIGPTEVARALGTRRQHVQQMMQGARPLYVEHMARLPEELRDYMIRELLKRHGQTIADRLEPGAKGVRRALADLGVVALEAGQLARELWGQRTATAALGTRVRSIGERAIRIGASLVEWAELVERERVVGLEGEDEEGDR